MAKFTPTDHFNHNRCWCGLLKKNIEYLQYARRQKPAEWFRYTQEIGFIDKTNEANVG